MIELVDLDLQRVVVGADRPAHAHFFPNECAEFFSSELIAAFVHHEDERNGFLVVFGKIQIANRRRLILALRRQRSLDDHGFAGHFLELHEIGRSEDPFRQGGRGWWSGRRGCGGFIFSQDRQGESDGDEKQTNFHAPSFIEPGRKARRFSSAK